MKPTLSTGPDGRPHLSAQRCPRCQKPLTQNWHSGTRCECGHEKISHEAEAKGCEVLGCECAAFSEFEYLQLSCGCGFSMKIAKKDLENLDTYKIEVPKTPPVVTD